MTITIPSDEALGLQIKRIIAAVALVAVAFYVAGYTLGTAVHQLNASLSRLPLFTLTVPAHADPHPALPAVHGNHCVSARGSRQPKPQPKHSKSVGFKL